MGKNEDAIQAYEKAAEVYSQDSLFNNATAVCKKILRITRENPKVFWRLGDLYAQQGLINDAITNLIQYAEMVQKAGNLDGVLEAYQKIVGLSPRNTEIRGRLADLYASQGKKEEAGRELRSVADFYHEHGRIQEAEAVEDRIRELTGAKPPPKVQATPPASGPKAPFPGFVSSDVSFESLFPDVAGPPKAKEPEVTIQEVASVQPPAEETRFDEIFAAGKPAEEMKAGPEEAVPEKPADDSAVSVELGELLLDIGSTQEATEQFHRAAEGYFNADNLEKAQDLYRRIAELQPLEIRTRQKLVQIAQKTGNREDGIKAYLGLAECLLRRERKDQAKGIYEKVLDMDPGNETALENLSIIAPQAAPAPPLKEKVPAPPLAEKAPAPAPPVEAPAPAPELAPAPEPEPAPAQAVKGPFEEPAPLAPSLLGGEEKPAEVFAAPPVSEAAAPSKEPPSLTPSLLSDEEKPPEAGEHIESGRVNLGREIVEGGRKSHVKFSLAEPAPAAASEDTLSIGDIIEEFKEGVFKTVSQEDYASHYDLGIAYKEMALLEEAIMEFQIAAKGTAERLKSLEMLGICFLEKDEPQFAVRQFQQGLEVEGQDPERYLGLHYHLATALERLGDVEGAVKHLEEVYAVNAKFMDTASRLRKLRSKLKKAPPKEKIPVPTEIEARLDEILTDSQAWIPDSETAPAAQAPAEEAPPPASEPVPATAEATEARFPSSPEPLPAVQEAEVAPAVEAPAVYETPPEVPGPVSEPVSEPAQEAEPEAVPESRPEKAPEAPTPEKPKPEVPKKRKISYV